MEKRFGPNLVNSGEDGDGPIPDVPGMVHVPVLDLHLRVLDEEHSGAAVHVQGTLEHRACAVEFILTVFPLSILEP